jgi:hypothetical protein
MSRSRKKSKIYWFTTATSEKEDKRRANRKLRRVVKKQNKLDEALQPKLREVSNVWAFDKDGKRYDKSMTNRDLRK